MPRPEHSFNLYPEVAPSSRSCCLHGMTYLSDAPGGHTVCGVCVPRRSSSPRLGIICPRYSLMCSVAGRSMVSVGEGQPSRPLSAGKDTRPLL